MRKLANASCVRLSSHQRRAPSVPSAAVPRWCRRTAVAVGSGEPFGGTRRVAGRAPVPGSGAVPGGGPVPGPGAVPGGTGLLLRIGSFGLLSYAFRALIKGHRSLIVRRAQRPSQPIGENFPPNSLLITGVFGTGFTAPYCALLLPRRPPVRPAPGGGGGELAVQPGREQRPRLGCGPVAGVLPALAERGRRSGVSGGWVARSQPCVIGSVASGWNCRPRCGPIAYACTDTPPVASSRAPGGRSKPSRCHSSHGPSASPGAGWPAAPSRSRVRAAGTPGRPGPGRGPDRRSKYPAAEPRHASACARGQLVGEPGDGVVERGLLRAEYDHAAPPGSRAGSGSPPPRWTVVRASPRACRPPSHQSGRRVELVLDHQQAPGPLFSLIQTTLMVTVGLPARPLTRTLRAQCPPF